MRRPACGRVTPRSLAILGRTPLMTNASVPSANAPNASISTGRRALPPGSASANRFSNRIQLLYWERRVARRSFLWFESFVDFGSPAADDGSMGRALLVAMLLVISSSAASAQALSTLHITVTLTDPTGKTTPVARHALLISDEPPTTEPRRIFTTLAGTADVQLRPGRYVVESDQPMAFQGKSYEWSRRLEIVAGRDATLALTADNASVGALTAAAQSATASATDPSLLASEWQESVVALWTPTQHASGFVVDARGLIVTNQRVVGTATSAEVQFAQDIRVRATVLALDPERDVAILRVNPSLVSSLRPLPLGCGETKPSVANRQALYTVDVGMEGQRRLAPRSDEHQ